MSVYGYTIQIYCDFSGYTDIAIGVALLLGFRLTVNFNAPYISQNITEFWRRWHISLSTWLKDYLYISLRREPERKVRQYVNLFITMLLGGLWHGAHIKFLIWGALHGSALAFHKLWMQVTGTKGEGKTFWEDSGGKLLLSILWHFAGSFSGPIAWKL
jgi:alginate O-acetyltransferase complex protein AlgI